MESTIGLSGKRGEVGGAKRKGRGRGELGRGDGEWGHGIAALIDFLGGGVIAKEDDRECVVSETVSGNCKARPYS